MTPIERAMMQVEETTKALNMGMTVEEYRKQQSNQQRMENVAKQRMVDDYHRLEKKST